MPPKGCKLRTAKPACRTQRLDPAATPWRNGLLPTLFMATHLHRQSATTPVFKRFGAAAPAPLQSAPSPTRPPPRLPQPHPPSQLLYYSPCLAAKFRSSPTSLPFPPPLSPFPPLLSPSFLVPHPIHFPFPRNLRPPLPPNRPAHTEPLAYNHGNDLITQAHAFPARRPR